MEFRNTAVRYGSISKLFHWSIVLLVLSQYYSGWWEDWVLPKHSPIAVFYINNLHKPIGVLVLGIALLTLIWKINNPHPHFPLSMKPWEILSARLVHSLLYLGLFVMPVTGIITTTLAGQPPKFFGLYQFPQFIAKNAVMAHFIFKMHRAAAYTLFTLIVMHILAALKHHFIEKDDVLKRMLP